MAKAQETLAQYIDYTDEFHSNRSEYSKSVMCLLINRTLITIFEDREAWY